MLGLQRTKEPARENGHRELASDVLSSGKKKGGLISAFAAGLRDPNAPSGLVTTFVLLGFTLLSTLCLYYALQFDREANQTIRISLWIAFVASAIFAIGAFVGGLDTYKIRFLRLPSTWLTLLTVLLAIILAWMRRGETGSLTDAQMFLLAAISALSIFSLISNMIKTNVVFGVLLTIIQLMFSLLIVVIIFLVMARSKGPEVDPYTGARLPPRE